MKLVKLRVDNEAISIQCMVKTLREVQANFVPNHCCRETLNEYTMKLQEINEILLRAMAMSLNLEESSFIDQYGERPLVAARFNFYPPCPRPDRILGVKPHADASAFTFLLQDKEVEGLQFLKDNQWFRVPIIPHALLINVGDQVEVNSITFKCLFFLLAGANGIAL